MKKGFLIGIAVLCMVPSIFAADFSPTVMKITGEQVIQYDFDGSQLEIPVTVTGTPAGAIFSVFTKDKANQIIAVKNGFLGWHFVNKIDTCVYIGELQQLDVGKTILKWNGKNDDGGMVPAGEYTYYIYGYDNVNSKKVVSRYIDTFNNFNFITKITQNTDGSLKTQPEFYFSGLTKITIGSDPEDSTLIEKTTIADWGHHIELDPKDHNYFYYWVPKVDALIERVGKYQWVPNGAAVLQTDWGNDAGYCSFTISGMVRIANYTMADLGLLDNYIIVALHDNVSNEPTNTLSYISLDEGQYEKERDMSDWFYNIHDAEAGGQASGGPTQIVQVGKYMILSRFNACYRMMVDPLVEDDADFAVWGNGNGDYVGDHNFATDSARPWVCNDYNVAPYAYYTDADANAFSSFGSYDMGAVSFGLIAPDGTGIGYFAFAGETANIKYGTTYLDYDSPYDGIYTDNRSTGTEAVNNGIWFLAHDSFKGVITSNPVSVEESAPAAFAVSQNSPNPFNPTTTISFTIPEAGNVEIAVFSVSGQRVATIADGFMSAGSHSVTWDASGFSAGVYFYTVKSGDYSKTMKMTLLK